MFPIRVHGLDHDLKHVSYLCPNQGTNDQKHFPGRLLKSAMGHLHQPDGMAR
jgi:hypothetical protein